MRLTLTSLLVVCLAAGTAAAQPSGAHPRIWLDADTRTALQAAASIPDSAVSQAIATCADVRANPDRWEYTDGGWQGFNFCNVLSECLIAWKATDNADDLQVALQYFNVLLDDYAVIGDGAGGDDVVMHDSGYAMRTFAPYAALGYDWLHDAPGMTEALRAHARGRFAAWMAWYETDGYLNDLPGANYHAGYVFGATLIAIAEGSEAGSVGDAHWATVTDTIWGTDMARGLAEGAVLDGGDWAEGWQYGPLSVLEYALSARALIEQGESIPRIDEWLSELVTRYHYALTPSTRRMFPGGDNESDTANLPPSQNPLYAAIAGPAPELSREYARALLAELALEQDDAHLFEALVEARAGAATPFPTDSPTMYFANGTGNFFMRSTWGQDAVWAVFQCSGHIIADHDHYNSGNFVLTRGADDVVMDPTPYGSLSTLTGNAPTARSGNFLPEYAPSQADWGEETRMVWSIQSTTGLAVARCDYADSYQFQDIPSDVSPAIRDFIMVPSGATGGDGTVILIDRVVTGDAGRQLYLRVRTPAASLAGTGRDQEQGTIGASAITVQTVMATDDANGATRQLPVGDFCDGPRGQCELARLPGMEYRVTVNGPAPTAITVVDASAAGAEIYPAERLEGPGYIGTLAWRNDRRTVVIAGDVPGVVPASLSYTVPANGALHVVVDAPVGPEGRSDVAATLVGADCQVTVTPHAGATEGYAGRPLLFNLSTTCAVTPEDTQNPIDPPGPLPPPESGGCGCRVGVAPAAGELALLVLCGVGVVALRRRRRKG